MRASARSKRASLLATTLTLLAAGLFLLPTTSSPARSPASLCEYRFQHENILGTSLDLTVIAAREADAEACETAILNEIERLRQILSTYDSASEISRVNRETGPVSCSPE